MAGIWVWALSGLGLCVVGITIIVVLSARSWKIPLVIFKNVGDSRRPLLQLRRKGKIIVQDGVRRFKVQGTPTLWEMRNFKNENFYLTDGGAPALVLFEFAKDCFTPMRPGITKNFDTAAKSMPFFAPVGLEFDDQVMNGLMLKAVDDFDPDFIIRNFARIDRQYTGGWASFLKQYGWIIGWLLLFILAIVGIVLFFQKAPELARACAQASAEVGKNILERAADYAANGGPAA